MIVLLLVFGAIINVAVAWGCMWFTPIGHPSSSEEIEYLDRIPDEAVRLMPDDWLAKRPGDGFLMFIARYQSSFGVDELQFGVSEQIPGVFKTGPDRVLHIQRAGWPSRSLTCSGLIDIKKVTRFEPIEPSEWSYALRIPEFWKNRNADWFLFPNYERRLPARPIPSGFIINTIAYSICFALIVAGAFQFRKMLRARRGLCPYCAYPVGVSDNCTECGRPLGRKAQRQNTERQNSVGS